MHEWGFKQFRIRPPTRIKASIYVFSNVTLNLQYIEFIFKNLYENMFIRDILQFS